MTPIDQADKYLVEQIRLGSAEGWRQLVERYQGRLLAFARAQLSRKSEAEDVVQDTLVQFLQSLANFRDDASLETYLFTILRRKLIDLYRGRQLRSCFIEDIAGADQGGADLEGSGASASFYIARDEQAQQAREMLSTALSGLLDRLKQQQNFRDLKIIEMLFYAQLRNKSAAAIVGIDEKQIALIKHRLIKELRASIETTGAQTALEPTDSLLSEVWERQRFTCPKRSTIGRFLLGALDGEWGTYVDFHVNKLGCKFCQANVEDLKKADDPQATPARQRIFESTIGFFRATN